MNASFSPWAPSISRLLLLAALLCVPAGYASAQASGSDYTKDLPSVERVKAQIKGTDESDSLARQAAVFTYLVTYIDRIKSSRSFKDPYTPAELSMRNAYSLAAYQIEQDYKKTHTPAEAGAWSMAEGRYEINNALDWIHQLSGAQSNAAYGNAESVYHASAKKMYDKQMQENEEAKQRAQAAQNGSGSRSMANDSGSVAVRRCLELGGSNLQCLGKGMGVGFLDMMGMSGSLLLGASTSSYAGLTLAGGFKSGNGIQADFSDTTVGLSNCGKLFIDSRGYTIQRNGSQILIQVKNSPSSFAFALGVDGKLQGPASTDIAGKVITGYQNVWVANPVKTGYFQSQTTTSNQELTGLEAGQYAGQSGLTQNGQTYNMSTSSTSSTYVPGGGGGGHYENVPIYTPKTQACSIGTLMPGPPAAPDPGLLQNTANVLGTLFGEPANSSGNSTGNAAEDALAPGIRMAGIYTSSGGLKAQFTAAFVELDCGEAHVRDKYAVERTGSRILVHVQNAGAPFTVMVQPDGSLAGPASVTVAGRLVTGMNGNDVAFTPHSETCNLGSFLPGTTAIVSASAVSDPSAVPPRASPVVAASASTAMPPAAPVQSALRVLIHAQLAEATVAGEHVFVMREPLDIALRKVGLSVPAGATPAQAMRQLAAACHATDCKPIYANLAQHFITTATLDAEGKATLSAHATTGPYYFFAIVRTAKGVFMWDVPAHLAAGDNTVTLTASNADALGQ